MAGGPLFPSSHDLSGAVGEIFPNFHSTTTNGWNTEGFGVIASLATSRDLLLEFQMPPSLPTGTAKLVVEAISSAVTGTGIVNPRWKSFATEEDTDIAKGSFPAAEGNSTITWATADDDQIKQNKITLDADTIVGWEPLQLH